MIYFTKDLDWNLEREGLINSILEIKVHFSIKSIRK